MTSRRRFLAFVGGALAAGQAAAQLDPNIQALRRAALAKAIQKATEGKPVPAAPASRRELASPIPAR